MITCCRLSKTHCDFPFPLPVIYQSGYLTIIGYDPEFESYTLEFLNKEVEEGFMKLLILFYTPVKKSATNFEIKQFVNDNVPETWTHS